MTSRLEASDFQARLARLDALLREAEHAADPVVRSRTREVVQAVLDLHGAGLERMVAHLADAGAPGAAVLDACARDEIVGGMLLLHDLHPLDVEARVRQALESVRPYLRSHGGNVELLGVAEGIVRLRLEGSCHSCPSSTVTMQQTVEEAVYGRAPEIAQVEVEGLPDGPTAPEEGARVALPLV